ncbi:MAG TPA: nucleotidyl transferase AbiEii/AbiGii toxin family protein [Cyclobacteriaceae bacterium]|nr:nucleotidyl transferase AbiEii/AbiGii toxin family protein [Cyclobacteriaceae bacterium]
MISKDEIMAFANETGLAPTVVEKDYVLGWLLAGIYKNAILSSSWIFKGGTCIKKCYFETYRFSEDLDFTLKDQSHLEAGFLTEQFSSISNWIGENVGLVIPSDRSKFDIHPNKRNTISCEGRIYYESYFVAGKRELPKVKVDLTADELLALPPVERKIFHGYSDDPDEGISAKCYSFEELFAEKVRALSERGRPRDLYDVVNLYRNENIPTPSVLRDLLGKKCAFKNIATPTLDGILIFKDELLANWEPMLGHQLPALLSIDTYLEALPAFFSWLERITPSIGSTSISIPSILNSVSTEGAAYRPRYGHLRLTNMRGESLEIIRFAAGNRLCVDLGYQGSTRRVEPYSLRETQAGNILLYAVKSQTGEIRGYRVDKIESASVTNQVFRPRYLVELSPSSQLSAPRRFGDTSSLGLPRRSGESMRSKSTRNSSGPKHQFKCSYCGKIFTKSTYSTSLNPHKNKSGWACPGRIGYFVKTIY